MDGIDLIDHRLWRQHKTRVSRMAHSEDTFNDLYHTY